METMYGSGLNTAVTCEKEALTVLLVSAALVGSYVLAQDHLSLVQTNKDGTKGDNHAKNQSEPYDTVSDVGSEDDDDDDEDDGDGGLGEGEKDLPSDEGEYGNSNNKSNAKKDPLDSPGGDEENGEEEEASGDDDDDDENDDDDGSDDDDDGDGGEEDEEEDEPVDEEEDDEEEETLQPPKKRKKQN